MILNNKWIILTGTMSLIFVAMIIVINSKISNEIQNIETKPPVTMKAAALSHQEQTRPSQNLSAPLVSNPPASAVSSVSNEPKKSDQRIIYEKPLDDAILLQ